MSSYENALQAFRWLHAAQHLPMESDLRKIRHYTPQEVDRGGGRREGGREGGVGVLNRMMRATRCTCQILKHNMPGEGETPSGLSQQTSSAETEADVLNSFP